MLALSGLFFYLGCPDGAIFRYGQTSLFMYGPSHIGSIFDVGSISVIIQGGLIVPLTNGLVK